MVTSLLASIVVCGALVSSARGQLSIKLTGSVTLAGSLDDWRVYPIGGALITLYSLDRILQTKADASGHFRFDSVPTGVYELEVASPPYKTKTIDNVRVTAATRSEELQFNFALAFGDLNADCGRRDKVSYGLAKTEEGNSIIGTVLSEPNLGKSPVANARVSLLSDHGVKLAEQVTSATGSFHFEPTVPGRYQIEMRHPSYNLLKSTVFWTARENRTSLMLEPVPAGWLIVCQ
jgi:hypothetical protein